MLRKLYEDSEVEAYEITAKEYKRPEVAKALGKSIVNTFNIVDEVQVKYYSSEIPQHRKVLSLYFKFRRPMVVVWKRPA